jgi:hypothetical protein
MTTAHTTPTPIANYGGEDIFVVEGSLQALQVARTTVNLLEKIEKNLPAKNLAAGIAGVVGGMHGMVANAAALALYDGEDVYNFAAVVGDQVVCGTFEHADQFKNGEPVKAVVSKREGVLFVHAIMQTRTQQFYMPLGVFAGDRALFKHCMNVAWGFTILGWIFGFGMAFYNDMFGISRPNVTSEKKMILFAAITLFPPVLMFPMEFWTYRSFKGTGGYADAIFLAFGFPKPKRIDLRNVGSMNLEPTGWKQAWRADLMLQKLAGK